MELIDSDEYYGNYIGQTVEHLSVVYGRLRPLRPNLVWLVWPLSAGLTRFVVVVIVVVLFLLWLLLWLLWLLKTLAPVASNLHKAQRKAFGNSDENVYTPIYFQAGDSSCDNKHWREVAESSVPAINGYEMVLSDHMKQDVCYSVNAELRSRGLDRWVRNFAPACPWRNERMVAVDV
jgi:hypothetical protein